MEGWWNWYCSKNKLYFCHNMDCKFKPVNSFRDWLLDMKVIVTWLWHPKCKPSNTCRKHIYSVTSDCHLLGTFTVKWLYCMLLASKTSFMRFCIRKQWCLTLQCLIFPKGIPINIFWIWICGSEMITYIFKYKVPACHWIWIASSKFPLIFSFYVFKTT